MYCNIYTVVLASPSGGVEATVWTKIASICGVIALAATVLGFASGYGRETGVNAAKIAEHDRRLTEVEGIVKSQNDLRNALTAVQVKIDELKERLDRDASHKK